MDVLLFDTIIHATFFILLMILWRRIPNHRSNHKSNRPVTVIVPFRNEEKNLSSLLKSLARQDYPQSLIQFLLVNDHSEDHSLQVLEENKAILPMEVIDLPEGILGKKAALTVAVKEAKHELILCSDADCSHASSWISEVVSVFEDENVVMASGPVRMVGKGVWSGLQSLEFGALNAYGAITLNQNLPGMCNGANLSYLRSAFLSVDGYEGNLQIPTGDDEFLMQKISYAYPGQVKFIKSLKALVSTPSKENLSGFISQRIRWTSKWKLHDSWFIKTMALLAFIDFSIGFWLLAEGFISTDFQILSFILFRLAAEWLYLVSIARFFNLQTPYLIYPLISFIYPFYAVFLGVASIFGSYSWKGRLYK